MHDLGLIGVHYYWGLLHWPASILITLSFMLFIISLEMNFKTYKIEEGKLILREFFFFKNVINLDRVLYAKQKRSHFLRRLFYGWRKRHIKIYIYPLDYYRIFTDDGALYKELDNAVKDNPFAFGK